MIDQQLIRFEGARSVDEPGDTVRSRVLAFTLAAITLARQFAAELIDRLVRTAGPGEHFVACVTRRFGAEPAVHAGLVIVRQRATDSVPRAQISGPRGRRGFTGLLMYGSLTEEPVGLIMRSCADVRHFAPDHSCVIRGWVARDGRAVPMPQKTVWNAAGGPLGPHPCLPPHPAGTIRYETAYSLY
jgi:hypothetical protein